MKSNITSEDERAKQAFREAQDKFIKQKKQIQREDQRYVQRADKKPEMVEEETEIKPVEIEPEYEQENVFNDEETLVVENDDKTNKTDILIWFILILVLVVGALGILSKFFV